MPDRISAPRDKNQYSAKKPSYQADHGARGMSGIKMLFVCLNEIQKRLHFMPPKSLEHKSVYANVCT